MRSSISKASKSSKLAARGWDLWDSLGCCNGQHNVICMHHTVPDVRPSQLLIPTGFARLFHVHMQRGLRKSQCLLYADKINKLRHECTCHRADRRWREIRTKIPSCDWMQRRSRVNYGIKARDWSGIKLAKLIAHSLEYKITKGWRTYSKNNRYNRKYSY